MNNKFNGTNLNDHVIYCDICGCPCLYSEATVLDTYTGRGGLLVCPRDVDTIDYGLVPYVIPAEQPVDNTRINHFATNPNDVTTGFAPFDSALFDPMSYNPTDYATMGATWDQLDMVYWDTWSTIWNL